MEDKLWRIFENINSWLKYAENKNAYILAFIGTQLTLLNAFKIQITGWKIVSFIFLGLCFLVCILSFYPKTVISSWLYHISGSNQGPNNSDNLLFYGDIAKYFVNQYIDVMQKYLNCEIKGNKYLEDICGQIVVNANITNAKFNMYKMSFWLRILGQLFFLISFL